MRPSRTDFSTSGVVNMNEVKRGGEVLKRAQAARK